MMATGELAHELCPRYSIINGIHWTVRHLVLVVRSMLITISIIVSDTNWSELLCHWPIPTNQPTVQGLGHPLQMIHEWSHTHSLTGTCHHTHGSTFQNWNFKFLFSKRKSNFWQGHASSVCVRVALCHFPFWPTRVGATFFIYQIDSARLDSDTSLVLGHRGPNPRSCCCRSRNQARTKFGDDPR